MSTPNITPDIHGALGLNNARGGKRLRMAMILLTVILLGALAAWLLYKPGANGSAPQYRTQQATLGDLTVTVSATGNLEPTNQVDVSSELSGIVEAVMVDDNDTVKKGQVLARLDPTLRRDQVAKSKAALASAQAQVLQAVATVREARANLDRLREVARLSGGKVPARAELDTAEASLARAQADEAAAKASVQQAEAALRSDETNLTKTLLRSPIDGVVLQRKVEPGQTVASSLQAPVLFTLAKDLTHMRLQVNVDEADVGQVKPGQNVRFTVDAWRNRQFPAVITRVNYGSETTDGVVTYPTILEVANDDQSLRPGMTATAEITTQERENVLLVPNAALRFNPSAQNAGAQKKSLVQSLVPSPPPRSTSERGNKEAGKGGKQRIWVLRDGQPVSMEVRTGVTNGKQTEILGGELEVGMEVIIETVAAKKKK
ncbi:MAG: efflux RND transporter periplasmic adaptor subunit [Pseudomonadota bacterium]